MRRWTVGWGFRSCSFRFAAGFYTSGGLLVVLGTEGYLFIYYVRDTSYLLGKTVAG